METIAYTNELLWLNSKAFLTANANDFVERLKQKETTFEVVLNDIPCKLYFDIDYKFPKEEYNDELAVILEEKGKELIIQGLRELLPDITPNICIATSHTRNLDGLQLGLKNENKAKYSVRYFISNIKTTKSSNSHFVDEMNKLVSSITDVYDYFDEEQLPKLFDDSIYNNNKKMRCINSSKPNENRPLLLKEGTLENSVITGCFDDVCYEFSHEPITKPTKQSNQEPLNQNSKNLIDEISEKAEIIDLKYINFYPDWFKIICSLKNNNLNNHAVALHITKKSKHYDQINGQQYFQQRWDEIPVGKYNYSIGTFNHYAKSSNSKVYYEIIAKYRKTEISTVLKSPTEENIAKCFHSLFGEDFLFSNEIVYHWNGIVWEQSKTALRRCFTNEFTQIFINVQISYLNDMKNTEAGSDDYMFLSKKNKIITEIIKNLQQNGLIKAVVNDAIKPYIENNNVEFEMNPFSFCFNDKVFNLKTCEFMEPNKDDRMTLTTGYNYRKPTVDETKTLNDLFDKVFPIPEERKLYLISLATGLYGKTLEKFILANGSGRNGKGFTNELVLKTVGNYGYTCSNSVLLNPIKDGPNPTIANLNNKRIVFYREPDTDNNKKINSSTVKELTGGNEINARGLYSGNTKTQLKATHILECNTKPKMSGETDDAIFMRLIDMGFRSTFIKCENEIDESNYIFQGNDRIKDLDFQDQHKFALFHILIDHWKLFYAKNLNIDEFIPASILDRSKEYLKNSNEMFLWFEENYEKVEDDTEVIEISAIFEDFKNSNVCLNYTKAEKREMNKSKFLEKISKNLFLRKFYKERERRKEVCEKHKCKEMRNVLVGFKVMVENQEMS